jgi:hypothetical protein
MAYKENNKTRGTITFELDVANTRIDFMTELFRSLSGIKNVRVVKTDEYSKTELKSDLLEAFKDIKQGKKMKSLKEVIDEC